MMLCEGWATGASHASGGLACLCSVDDGDSRNRQRRLLRHRYPKVELYYLPDDDRKTTGNPGMYYAQQAQQAVGCSMFIAEMA